MTAIPLPINARTVLRRWLVQRGRVAAARALDRGDIRRTLALVPLRDRDHARALVEAMIAQRRQRREARPVISAEERALWRSDPVLRQAREYYLLPRRRRMWLREAREFLRQVYGDAARELLHRRGVRVTLKSFRAAVTEIRTAVQERSKLRVVPD